MIHGCLDDIPAFPVSLPQGSSYATKRTAYAGSGEGLSYNHRFEVKIFVKWYPLTTRCMVLDSELFIRFEKKIVLCISLHLKLNWVHRDWNFLTKAFLEKWSFLHELFSILQSSKWSLLSLELVGWTLGVTCLFFFFDY